MEQASLSEVELYYSSEKLENDHIKILGDECHHIKEVMRHNINDEIFVSNGKGCIYKTSIVQIDKKEITAKVLDKIKYPNKLDNIIFCIPRLKSTDRFEFALEKCVELGITKFIVFESSRTIAKGEKIERWQKILLAAMKQSLRAWLPEISFINNYNDLFKLPGKKIIFEQNSSNSFKNFLKSENSLLNTQYYFIFGPEGGLSSEELRVKGEMLKDDDIINIKLTDNRLRSETAIVTAASILINFH